MCAISSRLLSGAISHAGELIICEFWSTAKAQLTSFPFDANRRNLSLRGEGRLLPTGFYINLVPLALLALAFSRMENKKGEKCTPLRATLLPL
jgi:hypothetical protein